MYPTTLWGNGMSKKGKFGFRMFNGLDFSKSVTNPSSRLYRVVKYLRTRVGEEVTKKEILHDVFGLSMDYVNESRSRGYNSYLFSLGVYTGFFVKTRKGNKVFWSLGQNSNLIK